MTSRPWQLLPLGWILLSQIPQFYASEQTDYGLVDWLNSREGGYFNQKQEIRRLDDNSSNDQSNDSNDPKSTAIGVFAKERIEKGELLCQVPWNSLIDGDDGWKDEDVVDTLSCGAVRNVAKLLRLGLAEQDTSSSSSSTHEFAPYIRYLLAQPKNRLPSTWSRKGQALMMQVLGGGGVGVVDEHDKDDAQRLPPTGMFHVLEQNWFDDCGGSRTDVVSIQAALLVTQRADDEIMVPVYDMYNHRNGEKYHNTEMEIENGLHHQLRAKRTIEAGEQLHNSYNLCDECYGRSNGYGTPEILRDYGFVESLPQRWSFANGEWQFDLEEDEERPGQVRKVTWTVKPDIKTPYGESGIRAIRKEVQRLARLRNIVWDIEWNKGNHKYPQYEWDTIWRYQQALTDALMHALRSLTTDDEENTSTCTDSSADEEGVCSSSTTTTIAQPDHYYDLEPEEDDFNYIATCENDHESEFEAYAIFDPIQTHYQQMIFQQDPEDGDVCMILDEILQICTNYRPHYHEFSVHLPARFLNSVERVIFIGGGDSMLLHEVLKYPTLEKVVGLELDQYVVRQSFKYFSTQPHFDDPRVEWWFGDATKSLLMLPKEYWGTFDLVLVDLSETVMALSVTDDLHIFDALALLLTPEGIMVKNELYLEEMSQIFDYSLQVFYETPKICRQVLAMGSNQVDFLHHQQKDHNVETLLFRPPADAEERFQYIHDYRKNDARTHGKCESDPNKNISMNQRQSAASGILMVVEYEGVSVSLDDDLQALIETTIALQGFSLDATASLDESRVFIVIMQEGYVVARSWPDRKYLGLDIYLWSSFHKLTPLQSAVEGMLGSSTTSSYRIVVGGIHGVATWQQDQLQMGPQLVQARDCSTSQVSDKMAIDDILVRAAMDESVELLSYQKMDVAVLCGTEYVDDCQSSNALEYNSWVYKVTTYWTCPDLDESDPATMYLCEKKMIQQLEDSMVNDHLGKLDMFVIDATASKAMIQIFSSIWSSHQTQEALFKARVNTVVTLSEGDKTYGRQFLELYRKDQNQGPVARGEFVLQAGEMSYELGIVSVRDPYSILNLVEMEAGLRRRLEMDADVELRTIQGGKWSFNEYLNAKRFLPKDYDTKEAEKQFSAQESLGRQTIFQLEWTESPDLPSVDRLTGFLEHTMSQLNFTFALPFQVHEFGNGWLIVSVYEEATVLCVGDGRTHMDINFFSLDDDQKVADKFLGWFLEASNRHFKLTLRDDQPRGTGRVINFQADRLKTPDFMRAMISKGGFGEEER